MHTKRLYKKTVSATIFLGVIILITVVPTWFVQRQAHPAASPTPTPAFQPISVEEVSLIRHADRMDLVARLNNPNPRAGVADYTLTFNIFDADGKLIDSITKSSYVLPGSLQYIVVLDQPIKPGVANVVANPPSDPLFTAFPPAITLPQFSTYLLQRTPKLVGNQTFKEQKGNVTNTSTFDWQRVEVIAIAFSADNKPVSVGSTFVGTLRVQEQREFTLQWPMSPQPIQYVVTFATTNIFKDENVLKALGHPATLR